MSGRAIGANAESLENGQHPQTDRPDGGLGDVGARQRRPLCIAPRLIENGFRKDHPGQSLIRTVGGICFRKRGGEFGERTSQIATHVHVLTALPGKQESGFPAYSGSAVPSIPHIERCRLGARYAIELPQHFPERTFPIVLALDQDAEPVRIAWPEITA